MKRTKSKNKKNKGKFSRLYLGIDPGATGAVALIDDFRNIVVLADWPGDEIQAARIIREMDLSKVRAVVEKVHHMPGQGGSSSFKFGTNYGVWKGILAMAGIPYYEAPPQKWQKGVITTKAQDKKPSLAIAGRLFPKAELVGPKGGGKDGRSDALLIADYCRKTYVMVN